MPISLGATGGGLSFPFGPRRFFEAGVELQKFLDDSGMTSGELARQIGVTQKAVYYWLKGGRLPRPNNIRAIVSATNGAVTAADLLDAEEPQQGARL